MRIVSISDTHCQHRKLKMPKGDIIIHAGDICKEGTEGEVQAFLRWFSSLNFTYKIFIAGNHDFFFDGETKKYLAQIIPENICYLNDTGIIIEGINFWGSPVTPWLYDGAFNRKRGPNISKHWKLIPSNTDILITHGPPHGILDKNRVDYSAGCKSLRKFVTSIQPRLHIFGHIHESYGQTKIGKTTYMNACMVNEEEICTNVPLIYEL